MFSHLEYRTVHSGISKLCRNVPIGWISKFRHNDVPQTKLIRRIVFLTETFIIQIRDKAFFHRNDIVRIQRSICFSDSWNQLAFKYARATISQSFPKSCWKLITTHKSSRLIYFHLRVHKTQFNPVEKKMLVAHIGRAWGRLLGYKSCFSVVFPIISCFSF